MTCKLHSTYLFVSFNFKSTRIKIIALKTKIPILKPYDAFNTNINVNITI